MLEKHKKIEKNSVLLLILTVVVISIGGLIEIVPLFKLETTIEPVEGMRPYTPLELAGQSIYLREGCYNCHSQQIRPLRDEVARYGHYSLAAESMYDFPFQWGSKRTGPDLARVGGKYSDEWHAQHLIEPSSVVPETIMPSYSHLARKPVKLYDIDKNMWALQKIGVPYTQEMLDNAYNDAIAQLLPDSDNNEGFLERYGDKVISRDFDGNANVTSELDALIAYLQMLGTLVDLKKYQNDQASK